MTARTASYLVTYTVPATSRLQAVMKAGELLRGAVRVTGPVEAAQLNPVWWDVTFPVTERLAVLPEPVWPGDLPEPDPIDQYKSEHERWLEAELREAYGR